MNEMIKNKFSRKLPIDSSNDPSYVGKLMEEYIESGSYKHMKELYSERDVIQQNIYDHLINHESRRHEIGCNLVAKFILRNVFQYDYVGLNELLYDHGLLHHLIKLSSNTLKNHQNLLDLLEPYQLKPEFYIKPALNKVGRNKIKVKEPLDLKLGLEDAAKKKKENMISLKIARKEYNNVKIQITNSWNFKEMKKVEHKYGSLSQIQKPIFYDVNQINDRYAIQALIDYGKPNMEKLDYYMMKGFISKSEVEKYRKLMDIKVEFVVLDLDEEASMLTNLNHRKMRNLIL